MRVLIVEDEGAIARRVEATCVEEGFACDIAATGSDALSMIKFYDYDTLILDLILPDIDGFEILSRIRAIKNSTPVIVLSGLNAINDKVKCLSIGADDYLTKPFSKVELLARINAVIRRTSGHFSSVIKVGPITIDTRRRCVTVYGASLPLTSREYAILELLVMKKGTVLPKEAFLNHIYGGMDEPEVKIVDVFICKLRKKISDLSGGINLIETVWGRGYTIRDCDDEIDNMPITETLKAG